MNLIKTKQSSLFIVLSIFLIVIIIYLALVIFDFILFKYISRLTGEINEKALLIEQERYQTQDIPMIREAEKLGYSSIMLTPETFETHPVTKFIEEYKILPLAPRPYTKYYMCNEGYGLAKYKSDRFGFRNKDSIWEENKIDILLIGDSFAHGACVEEKDSIAGLLTAKSLNVINLSTHGNGAIHFANIATTFTEAVKPKYLVLITGPNDNSSEKNNIYNKYFPQTGKTYFDNYGSNIRPKKISNELNDLYKKALPLIQSIKNQSTKKMTFLEGNIFARGYKYFFLPTIRRTISDLFNLLIIPYSSKLMIDTIISECKKNKCQPIIVYLPTSNFWRPDSRSAIYLKHINNYILSLNNKPIFIDLSIEINKLELRAHSISGPHLSPLGNKVVMNNIIREIK